jgi:hypothetical protein
MGGVHRPSDSRVAPARQRQYIAKRRRIVTVVPCRKRDLDGVHHALHDREALGRAREPTHPDLFSARTGCEECQPVYGIGLADSASDARPSARHDFGGACQVRGANQRVQFAIV